jgi:type II secretory ATPase GspE/PulE/Tfp pilus assembly ATPase PilB-like protein
MRDGIVSKEILELVLSEQGDARQRLTGRRLGEILVERGLVTPTQVARLLAEQYELPYLDLHVDDLDPRVTFRLNEDAARRFSALPVGTRPDGSIVLAIADPATVVFSDELRRLVDATLHFTVVGPEALEAAMTFVYDRREPTTPALHLLENPPTPPTSSFAGSQRAVAHRWPPLGALLIQEGHITDTDLETALAQQRLSTTQRLGEILVERGIVSRAVVARLVADQYELDFVELGAAEVDPLVARLLPESLAREYLAVPIAKHDDGSLDVAIADPTNIFYTDEFHQALGAHMTFVVASQEDIRATLDHVHAASEQNVEEIDAQPHIELAPPATESSVDHGVALVEPDVEPVESIEPKPVAELRPEEPEAEPTSSPFDTDGLDSPPEVARIGLDDPRISPTGEDTNDAADIGPDERPAAGIDATLERLLDLGAIEEIDSQPGNELAPSASESSIDHGVALVEPAFEPVESIEPEPVAELRAEEPGAEPTSSPFDTDGLDSLPEVARIEGDDRPMSLADERTNVDLDIELDQRPATDIAVTLERLFDLGASALHFSPVDGGYLARVRLDGVVREAGFVGRDELQALVEHLEAITPLRTRTTQTTRGEKLTVFPRVHTAAFTTFSDLGLGDEDARVLNDRLAQGTGVVVMCGPANSGLTTTLHAALAAAGAPDRVVVAVGPCAPPIDGVDQVEVDTVFDGTFAQELRAVIESDADVIALDEITDDETARLAFQAGLSGREVLAVVRAPTAWSAIRRLSELGIAPGTLSETLACVVSQRLLRRVCADCRETYYATDSELAELHPTDESGPRLLARGRGCDTCGNTGYRGQAAIFEVLPMTADILALIASEASAKKLRRAADAAGMRTLREEAISLCLEGTTTSAEVRRVLELTT